MSTIVEHDQVFEIAQEVFAAMIDGDVGLLQPWEGALPVIEHPLVAWVDVFGDWGGRAALTTATSTAHDLARILLELGDDEEVTEADLVDAFGEVANVVGGNVKSLLPTHSTLGLPHVAQAAPHVPGSVVVQELPLAWRGRPLVVTVWGFDPTHTEGERS